ncbi:phytanoyl-CoA dioxygenase family protein [Planctobacterium marinum]|uniref:Phytanoyl-CoA dioxygenase n=1 Tax=Planctobacterium marinum TaxID=1631968 RepID=A0AA48KTZ2_9ALTE|nr:hypothetical protein MACH26_42080 [Planctobacterium marinum]
MEEKQIKQFQEDGYCLIENVLSEDLLQRWRTLSEELECKAVKSHKEQSHLHGAVVVEDKPGPRLMRFDDIFAQDPDLILETLALPAVLEMSKSLCGRGSVPVQMDVLFKQQHPHPVIKWHQGAQHSRHYPYLNVGIYLDDAPAGDGCLRYLPGTQHELQDIDALSKEHGWEIPGVIEQPAKAGDMLVQDMMILHGSQPKRSPGVRRTIYIELRPWQSIVESKSQSEHWAELRKQWMSLVLQKDAAAIWPQLWLEDYPDAPEPQQLINEILERREPPQPAVWGIFPVESKNYPVPDDMLEW